MTTCGTASERTAAGLHGAVALLYLLMLAYHIASVVTHWRRA